MTSVLGPRLLDYKYFIMLNSTEHEVYNAHKTKILNLALKLPDAPFILLKNCWHF